MLPAAHPSPPPPEPFTRYCSRVALTCDLYWLESGKALCAGQDFNERGSTMPAATRRAGALALLLICAHITPLNGNDVCQPWLSIPGCIICQCA